MSRIYSRIIIYSSPWWKIKFSGLENIDKDKAYVIMPNHQSIFDIPIVCLIDQPILWVAKKEILSVPLINFVVMMRNDIMIKRGTLSDSKRMIKRCRKELKRSISVSICPEGTRSKDGRISEFKEGAFVAAKLGNADILPIVIDGSYDLTHPKNVWGLLFPATVTVNILEPIEKSSFADETIKDLKNLVHDKMLSYHKQIRPDLY